MSFSESEKATLTALAQTALPPGRLLPGAGPASVQRLLDAYQTMSPAMVWGYRALLLGLEARAVAGTGHRFASLPFGRRLKVLKNLESADSTRLLLRGLLLPLKLAYFDDPSLHAALGCRFAVNPPRPERQRWQEQIMPASTVPPGTSLECDAVVVGTGAGGAAVAHALAERGHAVLMVEEGEHVTRAEFTGRAVDMMRKLYRKGGLTGTVGNTVIPIPLGKAVGGTTLINSGTCFRVPASTLAKWQALGLTEFTVEALAPYYEQVERVMEVGPSTKKALGRAAELIAKGCDALGYAHEPLIRNAPGCDGQGLCCFGCPTDAKRSTNVSYVPLALERGAQLLTGFKVDRVLTEGNRAVGVAGTAGGTPVEVRARVVVLACGALLTPVLLQRNGLANASGELGKNLSIHPASSAIGVYDEVTQAWNSVPQGYAISEFHDEGILFEGAQVPLDLTAAQLTLYGPEYIALMERFNHSVGFGFMVKDTSRGRVTVGPRGEPLITYWLNRRDLKLIQRAFGILARVFFAGGATEVCPSVAGFERLKSLADVEALERADLSARQMDITAYHPLGTCRIGKDPLHSVLDPAHEVHDVLNLFVCDGSVMPSSLGVNPQMTIMAMSVRAAEFIDRRLTALAGRAAA